MKLRWILVLLFLFVIIFYQPIVLYNKLIFKNLLLSFVPSLFPGLILTNLFIESDGLTTFYNALRKTALGKIIFKLLIYALCFTLGLPSIVILADSLMERKYLKLTDRNNLITLFGSVSFSFVYGVCLSNIKDPSLSYLLLGIYLILPLLFMIFLRIEIDFTIQDPPHEKTLHQIISTSFSKTASNLQNIVIAVLLFSIPLFALEKITLPYRYIFEGVIEFSYPSFMIATHIDQLNKYFLLWIFLVPSLSLIFQLKLFAPDYKLIRFIIIRELIGITGVIMLSLGTILFH